MTIDHDELNQKIEYLKSRQSYWDEMSEGSLLDCIECLKEDFNELLGHIDKDQFPLYFKCLSLFMTSLQECSKKISTLEKDVFRFFLSDATSNILSFYDNITSGKEERNVYQEKMNYVKTIMDLVGVEESSFEDTDDVQIPFPDELDLVEEKVEPEAIKKEEVPPLAPDTYLIFKLAHNYYGLPVAYVKEIVQKTKINSLPGNNPRLRGVLNLRGKSIIITELFDQQRSVEENSKSHVIILDFKELKVGFIVDEVTEVISIESDQIQSTEGIFGSDLSDEIESIVKYKGSNTFILNLDRIFYQEYSKHG